MSQQAVTTPRRLVRQRTRWFQGHLQCWKRVPEIIRSRDVSRRASADLTYHLLAPAILLAVSVPIVLAWVVVALTIVSAHSFTPTQENIVLIGRAYAITFVPAWIYGIVYANRTSDTSRVRGVAYGHVFTLYSYMWMIAGWRATARTITKRSSWAKTTRTTDHPAPVPAYAPASITIPERPNAAARSINERQPR